MILKALVIGCGSMSIGTIYKLAKDPTFTRIAVYDIDSEQIHHSFLYFKDILRENEFQKLEVWPYNMAKHALNTPVFKDLEIIIANVPWNIIKKLIVNLVNLKCEVPLISITRPNYSELNRLEEQIKGSNMLVLLGAGLEPGLTELFSVYLGSQQNDLHELHIRCGGIPLQRTNPLGYKSVFGGKVLPFGIRESYQLKENKTIKLPRFSEVESFRFDEIEDLEVWNDGMLPWFPEHEKFKELRNCTQKTIRWSGYAEKIQLLKEMGFLDESKLNDKNHTNKQMTEEILHPLMSFSHSVDRDMVLLKIEAIDSNGNSCTLQLRDHYDEMINMTAMSRTTGFTVAILAKLLLVKKMNVRGLQKVERFFDFYQIQDLINELQHNGVRINVKKERAKVEFIHQR